MKISYNWLKDYIKTDLTPVDVADKLTLLGLEVEEIEETGSDFEGLVVGKILNVRSHPNADKLTLCDVNTGEETVQIVCGAKNVAAGQLVPVATEGATLPLPMKNGEYLTIKKTKLRGESSNGMICSEAELGLSDDHSGIMVLNGNFTPGTPLKKVLNAEKNSIFEIAITPNRPDATCHIGVARDLAAVTGSKLFNPCSEVKTGKPLPEDEIKITIKDPDKCHRYAGLIIDGVRIEDSPAWLQSKLKSIGLRPINNVVDITNFVLHETGQPLHAFDYHLIGGKEIIVRSFDEEITFVTLDSIERIVPAGSLFICDGNGPVAIAGVMGGENSEVTGKTTRLLIESAYFEPSSIRKTSKQLALQTDSSYRFERGIDPDMQLRAAYRAATMITEIAGGTIINGEADIHPVKTEPLTVHLRPSRVNHLLGTSLSKGDIVGILKSLEFEIAENKNDVIECIVPTFRPDITREVDLIEEVGRIFDYNNIPRPASTPFITPDPLSDDELFHQRFRHLAKSLRYKEIYSNSLLSGKEADLLAPSGLQIHTLNPVSQENTTLRTHLSGGFLKAVRYNLNRNATSLRFFELGHIFRKSDDATWVAGIHEHVHLMLGICGNKKEENWRGNAEKYSIFDLKEDVEALFDTLGILSDIERNNEGSRELTYLYKGHPIASLAEVNPDLLKGFDVEADAFVAEIDVTAIFQLGVGKHQITYTPIPKFPAFEFDAAFIVDATVRAGDLTTELKKAAGTILKEVNVFDVYEGENLGKGKKSIAFRLTFLDSNKTLNIKDVEPVVKKIVQKLETNFGAKLRS
jgi:phenylalanyl-tRNA synthetase beta chain